MTDTALPFLSASRRTLKCTICGQAARPGKTHCAACRAALKRARNDTVSQMEPLPRPSGTLAADRVAARKRANDRAIARAQSRPRAERPPHSRDPALRRVAIAVIAGVALVGLAIHFEARWPRSESSLPPLPAALPDTSSAADAVAAPETRNASPPAPRDDAHATLAAELSEVTAAPTPASRLNPSGRPLRPPPVAAAASEAVVVAPPVEVLPTAAPPAPAPPAAEPSPPNRWQLLTDAIARCARSDFLGRVVCEQRARLDACEGHWGQVAQCPSGIANDHGQ